MKRGFTLIEILVSVALFSVVMVVALGALLSLSSATRRAEAINSTINNLGGVVDSIARSIRTGTNYYCGTGGTGHNTSNCTIAPIFTFLAADRQTDTTYCLSTGGSSPSCDTPTAQCPSGSSCILLRKTCLSGISCTTLALTSPEVKVEYFSFATRGSTSGDNTQPIVNILVSGTVQITTAQSTRFNFQTSVAQRIYDL